MSREGKQQGWPSWQESCCAQREQRRSRLLSQAVRRGKKKRWVREKGDGREVSWVRRREDCTTGAGGFQKYTLLEQRCMSSDTERCKQARTNTHEGTWRATYQRKKKDISSPQLRSAKAWRQLWDQCPSVVTGPEVLLAGAAPARACQQCSSAPRVLGCAVQPLATCFLLPLFAKLV